MKSLAPEVLGWVVGMFAVGIALYLGYLFLSEPDIKLSDYIQILVLLVITGALVVSIYVQRKKEQLDESEVFLRSSIDLVNKAYSLLKNEKGVLTNDRVSWVSAARLLTRAEQLSKKISLRSHQIIYESEHDYQRHRFNDLLTLDGESIPIEFFLGEGCVLGDIGKSAYKTLKKTRANWLPTRAISVIYRFKAYPEGYEDPLDGAENLDKRELERLWLFGHYGVYNYFVFRKYFSPVSNKVFQIKDTDKAIEVSPGEINRIMPGISGLEIE